MRILIVEDDPHTRTAMMTLLRGEGHEVAAAFTAEAAIGMLGKDPDFDAVTLDIHLGDGGESGWAVAAYMQSVDRLRDVPIIIVSGLPVEEVRGGAIRYARLLTKAGVIVSKPVDGEELLRVLQRLTEA